VASEGLKGIWIVEQLDKTDIATWKLGIMLMAASAALGLVLIPILGEVNPDVAMAPPRVMSIMLVLVSTVSGFYLFCILALARTTESDLRVLVDLDFCITEGIKLLPPSRKNLGFGIVVAVIGVQILMVTMDVMIFDLSVPERFSRVHSSGVLLNVTNYLFMPITGVIIGTLFSIFVAQFFSLVHVARHIRVDLLRLDRYTFIANPATRFILLVSGLASFIPPIIIFGNDPVITAGAYLALVCGFFVFVPILILYSFPVIVLKDRIKTIKNEQLEVVAQALEGDLEVIKEIQIQGLGTPMTTSDLLTHQMFLESRWEWPLAPHVQKVILFGLLPPTTWILGAIIENALT
jgi:hypothetical protein